MFFEADLSEYLSRQREAMAYEVRIEPEDKLLNLDSAQYVDYLVATYSVEPLQFYWDAMSVDQIEKEIPAERHGFNWNVQTGKSYPRQVFVYQVPFSGSPQLLRLRPSRWLTWSPEMAVSDSSISFEIINFNLTAEAIRSQANGFIGNLKRQEEYSRNDVEGFNNSLPLVAKQSYEGRRAELLERRDLLHDLGVPVRKSSSVPETFSVDAPRRKIVTKPEAPSTAFKHEPSLPVDAYEHVLEVIKHVGVEMERHPAIYSDKGEEDLRDFLLMALAPNFESASGETFNKAGKTDILIRHEGSNVFVAECTMWNGPKKYLDKIDQGLGYLTWRDSKAAVVVFVRNKQFQPVLDKIAEITSTHPAWTKTESFDVEGVFRYRFHLPDDESRGVDLTVLVFHVPPVGSTERGTSAEDGA